MKKKDLERLKRIALKGDANAQCRLGVMYDDGQGVKQDYKEATKWYKLCADQGDGCAQFNLGLMYYNGYGVEENYVEALKWFKLSADEGHPFAQTILECLQV